MAVKIITDHKELELNLGMNHSQIISENYLKLFKRN